MFLPYFQPRIKRFSEVFPSDDTPNGNEGDMNGKGDDKIPPPVNGEDAQNTETGTLITKTQGDVLPGVPEQNNKAGGFRQLRKNVNGKTSKQPSDDKGIKENGAQTEDAKR